MFYAAGFPDRSASKLAYMFIYRYLRWYIQAVRAAETSCVSALLGDKMGGPGNRTGWWKMLMSEVIEQELKP